MEKFENTEFIALNKNLTELFTVGRTYKFYIESEEMTPYGKNLFILKNSEFKTEHHFCFTGVHPSSPGEMISLTVSGFTPNGHLILTEPALSLSEQELKNLQKVDEVTYEREGQHLELKSSFVYSSNSAANIDKQLGLEIMQQIAAMLNSEGGEIRIGYKADGVICGINKDIPYLNDSKYDMNKYHPTLDGIELKFRNDIIKKLGCYANKLVETEFFRTAGNLLVIHLSVKPSFTPVFLDGKYLYVRAGNTSVCMYGNDITSFICERCNRTMPDFPAEEEKKDFAEIDNGMKKEDAGTAGTILGQAKSEAISCYITLYKTGEISTQKYAAGAPDVLFNIPLSYRQIMDVDTRLVLAYENGHCAFFRPREILKQKLCFTGKLYANGWNSNSKILNVILCKVNDYIAVYSDRLLDDQKMLKVVDVKKYRTYDGSSMQAQGNKVVDKHLAKTTSYMLIAGAEFDKIRSVYMKSGYTAGYSVNKCNCADAAAFIVELQKNMAA